MGRKNALPVQGITGLVSVRSKRRVMQDVERSMLFGGCEKAKMARDVENTRANQGITYSE